MGFILSVTTTPKRLNKLIDIIPHIKTNYKFFVINLCSEYKRFGPFKIPKELLQLCKKNKKVVFNFMDDFGPVVKYLGGFEFMKKRNLKYDKLIVIDDDTFYRPDLFDGLLDEKTKDNITTGSGFNYDKNFNYVIVEGSTTMVEGYAGICFEYSQKSDFIFWYSKFYKHFDFKNINLSLIDKYLSASFLGDDFIISQEYENKFAIKNGRKYLSPQPYGFEEDALHKNDSFGSNMGSYKFLSDNKKIYETFKNKYYLNKEITKELINENTCLLVK